MDTAVRNCLTLLALLLLFASSSANPVVAQAPSIALDASHASLWKGDVLGHTPRSEPRSRPTNAGFGSGTYLVEGAVLGGLLLGIPLGFLYMGGISADNASSSGDTLLGLAGVATGAVIGGLLGSLLDKPSTP